jgi:hypothetical protein
VRQDAGSGKAGTRRVKMLQERFASAMVLSGKEIVDAVRSCGK